jgi:hypothetical protein
MKNTITKIRNTWTYNHKAAIVALALALAHVYPAYIAPYLPSWPENTVVYHNTTTPYTIEDEIEARALELYNENKAIDLEKYRQEAIREMNEKLLALVYKSPYVDYKALKEKHGY